MTFTALLLSFLAGGPVPDDRLHVVTTIPDLADFARRIGGDRVEVRSLTEGTENIHGVNLRPSHLIAVSKADLFLQMGLSLEHAFVPGLLMKARNARIEPGQPGFVDASVGWEPIDVPAEISRGVAADIHPMGNPHFNLDPRAGRHMAGRVLEGLVAVAPATREYFERRHAAYLVELEAAEGRWAEQARALAGRRVVTYHRDLSYFARACGLEVPLTIEAKPGVPPTAGDLARIIENMQAEGIGVILTARWSNDKSCRFVAERTGARLVEVPVLVGGVPGADSWIAMMDRLHASVAEAFADAGG